ncbi:chromosomal replication initiator protein DnaA [Dolosicoccus paucivorans]|uniref:Chromosomal replication initiator protein DnaA n=1 Tax=Dolosicoccus paucivorans TaxID=84521 RepID=A0A2N6SNZ6_9LACT|nr:chromosomal replication initiator protein DnaA [Dolosicoccus paucivorans]PMC58793.1 chromosomal replication initiator protein DnaA [Dolosicoccus paucivorans]
MIEVTCVDEKYALWEQLSSFLKTILSNESYETWVASSQVHRLGNQKITISVPNDLTKSYWERHLVGYVLQFTLETLGVEFSPNFIVLPPQTLQTEKPSRLNTEETPAIGTSTDQATHLNASYTFNNFVVGKGNEMAHAAAHAVAESPGIVYSPLLIYGGVGLGKTHLMQAIGLEIQRANPLARVRYATSEEFMNDFVTSLREGAQQEFREMYRDIDVLLIDDIQFFSEKDKTQEEFFNTFNNLFHNQKQIVLTSDRQPKDIANLEERLVSRFEWGLIVDITPPDQETRIAILQKKAKNKGIEIDNDSLMYIANHMDSNVRELEGALNRVFAYSAMVGKEINVGLTADALQSFVQPTSQSTSSINIDTIIEVVAQFYDITAQDIKSKRRTKDIVIPRQIAMYLARELTGESYPKLGKAFGNRMHTTILYGYEKIEEELKTDEQLRNEMNQLLTKFNTA